MKYYPYASLEAAKFKSLLKLAQRLGALSIMGFYVTLFVAAGVYMFGHSAQSASLHANEVLMSGIIICGSGLGLSALFALFISVQSQQNQSA